MFDSCGARNWQPFSITVLVLLGLACGPKLDPLDPTDVELGETTFVVVVNPTINDVNDVTLPEPGSIRGNVRIDGGGTSVATESAGIGVLGSVDHGDVVLRFRSDGLDANLEQNIRERDLVELAVSLTESGAQEMARVVYRFGSEVIELDQEATVDDVNDALSASNRIVLLTGGSYTGDLELSGSSVTLFGAGVLGGRVTIEGSVTVSGSGNRIRGTRIVGDLDMSGSDAGLSFSTIEGEALVSGSDSVLLENTFCGGVDISGGGTTVLGNAGLAPVEAACP
jgi:hypothetical protein